MSKELPNNAELELTTGSAVNNGIRSGILFKDNATLIADGDTGGVEGFGQEGYNDGPLGADHQDTVPSSINLAADTIICSMGVTFPPESGIWHSDMTGKLSVGNRVWLKPFRSKGLQPVFADQIQIILSVFRTINPFFHEIFKHFLCSGLLFVIGIIWPVHIIISGHGRRMTSPWFLNHRTHTKRRHEGAVRVTHDNIRIDDLLGTYDESVAALQGVSNLSQHPPCLGIAIGICSLDLHNSHVVFYGRDQTDPFTGKGGRLKSESVSGP